MILAENIIVSSEKEPKSDRIKLEEWLERAPEAHILLEVARGYLGWSHVTALKRFRRLDLPIYARPEDQRVKEVRLEDVLWVEEIFLASARPEWSDPFWWDDAKRLRYTDKDLAFKAPLPRSVGGFDRRHPNNLTPVQYAHQKRLREKREARYSNYRRKNLDI